MQKIKKIIIAGLALAPLGALAAGGNIEYYLDLIKDNILNPLVTVLISLAVILFLYGIIKYVTSGDSEDKQKEAKNYIVYGIVALFVMISIWGLVGILTATFETDEAAPTIQNLLPSSSNSGSSNSGSSNSGSDCYLVGEC